MPSSFIKENAAQTMEHVVEMNTPKFTYVHIHAEFLSLLLGIQSNLNNASNHESVLIKFFSQREAYEPIPGEILLGRGV